MPSPAAPCSHKAVGVVSDPPHRRWSTWPHHDAAAVAGALGAMSGLLATLINQFNAGICLVASDGAILFMNPAAHHLVVHGGLARLDAGCGRPVVACPNLRGAIAAALATGATPLVALVAAHDERAVAQVVPVANALGRIAAVLIRDAKPVARFDDVSFARLYGLTRAEARLVAHLAEGHTVMKAAACLKIQAATAKCHLRHVFDKCGVSRQAELIALVERLRPLAGPRDS